MPTHNFIDLDEKALDTPIYRIMPIHRLLQLLELEELVLVKPKKWDDPFENALLSALLESADGSVATMAAKDSVYGQCWTLHRETDAMWRIYSYEKNGARVSTTPRKVFNALKSHDPIHWRLNCFIGKVKYLSKVNLLKELGSIDLLSTDGAGIAQSLLYKRREFLHEKEVRIIYSASEQESRSDIFPFKIQPNDLIDKITFDPRMDNELAYAYQLAIEEKGYTGKITKSILYKPPAGLRFKI